jgi:hypothetical protein
VDKHECACRNAGEVTLMGLYFGRIFYGETVLTSPENALTGSGGNHGRQRQ